MTYLPALREPGPGEEVTLDWENWRGQRCPARYMSWAGLAAFLDSEDFRLVRDSIRDITIRALHPPADPEAEALEARAQREFACGACGAQPGEACHGPERGRLVHGTRAFTAKRAPRAEAG
jgi:hypothetical protein